MENNKLQQLTDKLYKDGLESGRKESEVLISKATSEAAKIVADAKAQAAQILSKATKEAEDSRQNSLTEITLAGRQAMATIKAELENLIVTKSLSSEVKAMSLDAKFLKDMMLALASQWSSAASGKVELSAMLPAAKQTEFDKVFKASVKELLAAGVEVGYSDRVTSGFRIAAKGEGYYLSFSEADFDSLMRQYLREKVSQMLF
ncbi:MAG: hypothetical protein SNJ33_00140 [Rikenellaceae bacterium]